MTMTASTLHCWKSVRLDFVRQLIAAVLLWFGMALAIAAGSELAPAEVTQFQVDQSADGVFLSSTVQFELPPQVEDALQKGVPMFFVAEVDIYRDRWYWYDKKVLFAERHMRLAYQPLTRRWRLNVATGAITANGLGVALNQTFDSLGDALSALRRLSRWKIAEPGDIDIDQKHSIEFRFRLDISQLPRPFQIGALGQADWSIVATTSQRLAPAGAK
jgi:Domain of unknown function (DUF4390)